MELFSWTLQPLVTPYHLQVYIDAFYMIELTSFEILILLLILQYFVSKVQHNVSIST